MISFFIQSSKREQNMKISIGDSKTAWVLFSHHTKNEQQNIIRFFPQDRYHSWKQIKLPVAICAHGKRKNILQLSARGGILRDLSLIKANIIKWAALSPHRRRSTHPPTHDLELYQLLHGEKSALCVYMRFVLFSGTKFIFRLTRKHAASAPCHFDTLSINFIVRAFSLFRDERKASVQLRRSSLFWECKSLCARHRRVVTFKLMLLWLRDIRRGPNDFFANLNSAELASCWMLHLTGSAPSNVKCYVEVEITNAYYGITCL